MDAPAPTVPLLRSLRRSFALAWSSSRPWVVIMVLAMLASALLPAAQVLLVRDLTAALTGGSTDRAAVLRLVVLTAVCLGLLSSLFEIVWTIRDALDRGVGGRAESDVNTAMARLTPEALADASTTTAARAAREAAKTSIASLPGQLVLSLRALITSITVVAALWPTSPLGGLLIVASLLPLMLLAPWSSKVRARAFAARVEPTRRSAYLSEQLAYQRTATELASLGTSGRVARMANGQVDRLVRIDVRAKTITTLINLLGTFASALIMGWALWLVVTEASDPASGAAAGVVALLSAGESISSAGYAFSQIVGESGPASSYFSFLDSVPAAGSIRSVAQASTDEAPPAPRVDTLVAHDLTYRYPGAERDALTDAGLTAHRGQAIAIVGVNGAGKTTLVNLLLGVLTPSRGTVRLDATDLRDIPQVERLAALSLLTQEFGRYELTVRQTVTLGTPREDVTDAELWKALEMARADGFVRALPSGLDTQLGQQWDGVGLSGGQWQRLALARVALRGAPVWLLDEPTSAVDAQTEAEIFDDLVRTKSERITLVVSHRASTLRRMDLIYVVDDGRIVECGTYPQLLHANGRFSEIFADERTETDEVAHTETAPETTSTKN